MAQLLSGLAYGGHPQQKLDLFLPERSGPRLFVFIHGGGWRGGDKEQYRALGELLANFGYAVALPNHRLAPKHIHPAAAEDIAAAIAWVLRYSPESGIRGDGIFLGGHSSGAHLAALLAVHPGFLPAAGIDRARIAGAICISGIYDLTRYATIDWRGPLPDCAARPASAHTGRGTPEPPAGAAPDWRGPLPDCIEYLEPVFGPDPAHWVDASPLHHLSGLIPPFFLAHAEFDLPGADAQAEAMAAGVEAAGGDAQVVAVPGRDHVTILTGVQSILDPLAIGLTLFLRGHAK